MMRPALPTTPTAPRHLPLVLWATLLCLVLAGGSAAPSPAQPPPSQQETGDAGTGPATTAGPEAGEDGTDGDGSPAGADPSTETDDDRLALPRIHNPGLFEKSVKAAAAATRQYGTVDTAAGDTGAGAPERAARAADVERVQRIGYRLAAESAFDKYPFSFGVVDMPIPNAFALPAGQIFVTRGMLDLGLTDDQLAALLGHEIAHVTQEHFLKMRRRATLLNSLAQLVTVGAIVADANSRDDVYVGPGGIVYRDSPTRDLVEASFTTGAVISELLLRSYNRNFEDESDEVGQRLAAAAGFDPDGARQLMAKMNLRIPQDKSFGYWQTHPFFDERVLAAEARARALSTGDPMPEASLQAYRRATQQVLLDATRGSGGKELERPVVDFLESSALHSWPAGPRADGIRLDRLHRHREAEEEKLSQSRDYGRLIAAYLDTAAEIESHDPGSAALSTLRDELGELRRERDDLLDVSLQILDGGIYQTQFLESFLSNFPTSPRAPEAALQLGMSYARLQREGDAVRQFLGVWEDDPESPEGEQAQRGLRNLAPLLRELNALEQLARQDRDPALAATAAERLEQQARTFEDITNGSAYLRANPEGLFSDTVEARIESLAENLYREMQLYEEVGESAKAIARANLILTHAPLSRAAQRLSRELAEEEIEEPGSIG